MLQLQQCVISSRDTVVTMVTPEYATRGTFSVANASFSTSTLCGLVLDGWADGWTDGWIDCLGLYVRFNSISVISER